MPTSSSSTTTTTTSSSNEMNRLTGRPKKKSNELNVRERFLFSCYFCILKVTNGRVARLLSVLADHVLLISLFFRTFPEYCWISMNFTKLDLSQPSFFLGLLGFTGFYRVSLGLTGFSWVLLGFTGFYWVLLGSIGSPWVWLGLAGFEIGLKGV